jgi:hypothetical protein
LFEKSYIYTINWVVPIGITKIKQKGKRLMNKLLSIAIALIAISNLNGQADESSVSVTTGYTSEYLVNGVARSGGSAFVGVNAEKSTKYVDIGVNGKLLPDSEYDQSHWGLTLGKDLIAADDAALNLTGGVTRHQSGVVGIPNSTEFDLQLTLDNKYIVPYVRGTHDIDLEQSGIFGGVYRIQELPLGAVIVPSVEYGKLNDYESIAAKVALSRPFGIVVPFVEVAWIDNQFDVANYNFATQQLDGDINVTVGVNVNF